MSIYRRDEILPEWEPAPWPMNAWSAALQERGFHQRAQLAIRWAPIPWSSFPEQGIFGQTKDWLSSADAACFATSDTEDLLLIDNTWFGWPDPPRFGLVSRPSGEKKGRWRHWGHFPDLPKTWETPPGEGCAGAAYLRPCRACP